MQPQQEIGGIWCLREQGLAEDLVSRAESAPIRIFSNISSAMWLEQQFKWAGKDIRRVITLLERVLWDELERQEN